MSRALRAQVSLIFSDEDLFDNFVVPMRDNRELSGLIIRLLTLYYNNEDIRNTIEGVSTEDLEDAEQYKSVDDSIARMRQTLAMQDFMFTQVSQTLEEGASAIDAIMKTNDIIKQSGVVKTEQTDVGEAVTGFHFENSTSESEESTFDKHNEEGNLEGRVDKIEVMLSKIMSMLETNQFSGSTGMSEDVEVENETETEENFSTESIKPLTSTTETEETDILDDIESDTVSEAPVKEVIEPVAPPKPVSPPEPTVTSVVEDTVNLADDASSDLDDILKDLLG